MHRIAVLITALATAFALAPAVGAQQSTVTAAPSDAHWHLQWGPTQVRADQAWATSTGAGQRIAIVDSGVDRSHPDLAEKIVGGATFVGCANLPNGCGDGDIDSGEEALGDGHPHGTHVAGIAAAITDNGIGIAGVAPDAELLAVKALNGLGEGSFAEVAAGVRWSVANGADVINLSLGALPGAQVVTLVGFERDLLDAIEDAVAAGVVVVAAAGNETAPLCAEPSFGSAAICVVATDRNEHRAWYSNLAVKPDLNVVAAPGGAGLVNCRDDIVSTVPAGREGVCSQIVGTPGYDFYPGTSMAAPHVAGVAALLTAQGRSAEEVGAVLRRTARTPYLGFTGQWTPLYGWGIVDAAAAVAEPVAGGAGTGAAGAGGGLVGLLTGAR